MHGFCPHLPIQLQFILTIDTLPCEDKVLELIGGSLYVAQAAAHLTSTSSHLPLPPSTPITSSVHQAMEKPVFCKTAEPLLSKCCAQFSGILIAADSECVASQVGAPDIDTQSLHCSRGQDVMCSVLFAFEKLQPSQKDLTALPEVTAAESSIKVIRAPATAATTPGVTVSKPAPPPLRGAQTVLPSGTPSSAQAGRRISLLALLGAAALANLTC